MKRKGSKVKGKKVKEITCKRRKEKGKDRKEKRKRK